MFGLTSCFLLSRNKNTENMFSKENVFLDLLKIHSLSVRFHFTQNEIPDLNSKHWKWDFIFFSFWFIWKNISLKMKTEIQPNTFSSPFSIFSENKNKKQQNQTPP